MTDWAGREARALIKGWYLSDILEIAVFEPRAAASIRADIRDIHRVFEPRVAAALRAGLERGRTEARE